MTTKARRKRQLPPTLTAEQAIELIGCGRTAGYQALKSGEFPVEAKKIGNRWFIPTAPLLRWLGQEED